MGFTEEIKEAKSGPVLSYMTELKKATDCKKRNGLTCTSTCPGEYTYTLDDELLKKCRSMAFLMTLNQKTAEYIQTLILREAGERRMLLFPRERLGGVGLHWPIPTTIARSGCR